MTLTTKQLKQMNARLIPITVQGVETHAWFVVDYEAGRIDEAKTDKLRALMSASVAKAKKARKTTKAARRRNR